MIEYKVIGHNLFELLEDYSEGGIEIAKGFTWNGASIPWYLRWLISPTDKTKEASMVHDLLYAGGNGVTRKVADIMFHQKLIEDGVSTVKAWVMKAGVRLAGWMFFKGL